MSRSILSKRAKANVTLVQETLLLEPMYEVPYVPFY